MTRRVRFPRTASAGSPPSTARPGQYASIFTFPEADGRTEYPTPEFPAHNKNREGANCFKIRDELIFTAKWNFYARGVSSQIRNRQRRALAGKSHDWRVDRFSVLGVVVLSEGGGRDNRAAGRCIRMADLCGYSNRPLAFIFRYVRLRPFSHAVILTAVLAAVACSVSTQYGVKHLVDVLSN